MPSFSSAKRYIRWGKKLANKTKKSIIFDVETKNKRPCEKKNISNTLTSL